MGQSLSFVARWRQPGLLVSTCLLLSSFIMISCSGLGFGGAGSTPTAKPTPSQVALAKLHWCGKPFILFRDQHAPVTVTTGSATATGGSPTATASATGSTTPGATPSATASATPTSAGPPTTVTEWSQIEPNLGFTVFLPMTLPNQACLVSASGTLHDPIFGGSFIIGYLLPDHSPISLSEAPMRTNSRDFQCTSAKGADPQVPSGAHAGTPTPGATASPSQIPILLCTGARDNTNIVFSARGSETDLKRIFDNLEPNVNWVPVA